MKKFNLIPIAAALALATGCSVRATKKTTAAAAPVESGTTGANGVGVSSQTPNVPMSIARAYGYDSFEMIRRIKFASVWTVDGVPTRRQWVWEPAENRVYYQGPDATGKSVNVSFRRDRLDEGSLSLNQKVDQWFRRDQYWLLFPFHLIWDRQATFSEDGKQPLPLGQGRAERISVAYKKDGDPALGDLIEIYFDEDFVIRQWTISRAAGAESNRSTTWASYAKVGPLLLSRLRESSDGRLRVEFDSVSVEMKEN
jgi:hypothetical protein